MARTLMQSGPNRSQGESKMTAIRRVASHLIFIVASGLCLHAGATPVTYTLQTVADGRIGLHPFYEARVTIVMWSDTSYVTNGTGSSAGYYENKTGPAQITITDGSRSITAHFAPGEVYVYFDSVNGIAGFGSRIAPGYPFSLGCADSPNQATYNAQTYDCLTGDGGNGEYRGTLSAVTSGFVSYPLSLSSTALMTGATHSCAGLYNFSGYYSGDLGWCPSAATQGLRTDRGTLYVEDQIGGSTGGYGPFSWGGWDTSNSGFLNVEVGH